ncbi:hypothetical protein LXA43DRAFT_553923 [Ganoderma leucocontextum]|nr:hypothetical protein LXA43DRAFT_553923 [Ganoderma leucocontextum]
MRLRSLCFQLPLLPLRPVSAQLPSFSFFRKTVGMSQHFPITSPMTSFERTVLLQDVIGQVVAVLFVAPSLFVLPSPPPSLYSLLAGPTSLAGNHISSGHVKRTCQVTSRTLGSRPRQGDFGREEQWLG